MADEKKSNDALLAELDDGAPTAKDSPDHIKKLLKMNPAMKPVGMDTNQAAENLLGAMQQAKQFKAAQQAPQNASLVQLLDNVRTWMKQEQTQLNQTEKDLQAEIAGLQKKLGENAKRKTELQSAACERFMDAMLAVDPNMTSPKTNVVLQSEKSFLDQIGFSPQKLMEHERKKKR